MKTLKIADTKFATLLGNREISIKHCTELKKLLQDRKKFSMPVYVVKVTPEMLTKHKLVDFETGCDITTANCSDYYVVIDGQHRLHISKTDGYEVNILELDCHDGNITGLIQDLNSGQKAWTTSDYIKSNIVTGQMKSKAIKCGEELERLLGNSWRPRTIYYYLTGVKDFLRKSSAISNTFNDPADSDMERGKTFLLAIHLYQNKAILHRNEVAEKVIGLYNAAGDDRKARSEALTVYLRDLKDEVLNETDIDKLIGAFEAGFELFIKDNTPEEISDKYRSLKAEIDTKFEELKASYKPSHGISGMSFEVYQYELEKRSKAVEDCKQNVQAAEEKLSKIKKDTSKFDAA